jgi:ABC-type spermidine/putrescine transport system permease subunit II
VHAPAWSPPGYPPGYPRPTNSLAIAALVTALSLAGAPVGLALGIAARRQIRRTGEQGDGLALAAVIVGGIATGCFVLLIVLLVVSWLVLLNTGFGP